MELKWTSKALSDLARLYDFLVLASKPAAARTVQSLTQAPVILLTHPRMGEQLFQFEPREVRRIFAGEYEIRYELNGQTIYVLRLWHTAYSALFDHGLASKSDQRFASIRSTGNLTFSTAF